MSHHPATPRARCLLIVGAVVLIGAFGAAAAGAPGGDAMTAAVEMVRLSGSSGGICAVVGAADAELPLALSKQGRFVVHCLCPDAAGCGRLRKSVRARGACGTVSGSVFAAARLPYADNLVNIVVVRDYEALRARGLPAAELVRALVPLGVGYVAATGRAATEALTAELRAAGVTDSSLVKAGGEWLRFRKPWPAEIDEWTHYLHGADGNPVARDRVVGPPMHYQWTSGPTWMRSHESDSSVTTLVTARGRLFYITDEAPISLVGDHDLPDKWFLAARDAFNGVPLWKVPIRRWGWREWKPSWFNTRPGDVPLNIQKRLVAVGDKVYATLGYHAPVSQLDARTGEILRTYEGTDPTGEILHVDGKLVCSVFVAGEFKVTAVDASTGKRLWVTDKTYAGSTVDYIRWRAMRGSTKPAKLDPAANLAADADTGAVALIAGPDIVCLNLDTGAEKWRTPFPSAEADRTAGGMRSGGNLWVGTMIVTGGVVLHASPSKLAALDAKTGKVLWSQPKKYIGHLWYEWKDVFVIDGLVWTWTADLERSKLARSKAKAQWSLYPRRVKGYELRTGKVARDVDLGFIFKSHHHHRCYRNKATSRYILASRRGTEFVDLAAGRHTVHNWVRGTCHVGMMPANGLQYAPPHPCVCYIEEKLNGLNALAPARASDRTAAGELGGPRIVRGEAFGKAPGPAAGPDDWPAFRHDAMRTGSASTRVPDGAGPLWRRRIGRRVSAPIVVGDRLFVSLVDEHYVVCLDAADGHARWEFAAGGRVDSPPTWHRGTVLFGSADGWVYCLRAADGRMVWRFRAAPRERLMAAGGQVESAWPVHGSVLVQGGGPGGGPARVYFAAGRSSQLDGGIHVYCLGATDGRLLHQTRLAGPDYEVGPGGQLIVNRSRTSAAMAPEGEFGENYALPMGTLPGILMGDGANIHMRTMTFNAELNRTAGRPDLAPKAGFLDGSYFKRVPWTFAGKDPARLIVHDKRSVYYVRMFDSLHGLDPSVYFTPGAKGYLLFARGAAGKGKRDRWSQRVPVRICAMALTADRLFVAGPPDVVDPADPLGAFEGRRGGLLYVIDSASGEKLATHKLPMPPVFNGAAVAGGRLFITEVGGAVTCFGKR
jgi:outer membrane protein assembly factor BamB